MTWHRILGMCFVVLLGFDCASPVWGEELDLAFPHSEAKLRLRLNLQVADQSPDAVWNAFLDKWLQYFDRDGNKGLSGAEATRVFPLPLISQQPAPLVFSQVDANGDGNGSREELGAYYRQMGFHPIVFIAQQASPAELRLSEFLYQQLDQDGDATLSAMELRRATDLLHTLDADEDDVLTVDELQAGSIALKAPSPGRENGSGPVATPDVLQPLAMDEMTHPNAILNVVFGAAPSLSLTGTEGKLIEPLAPPTTDAVPLRVGENACAVSISGVSKLKSFQSAKSFCLAQFRTAFGDKTQVSKRQISSDASLKSLIEMFDPADRDLDGSLNLMELTGFLALIEEGVASQTIVTLSSHGRNLFETLDTDQDRRLTYSELNGAATRILPRAGSPMAQETSIAGLTRDQIGIRYQLHIERGTPGNTFGPIQIPGKTIRLTQVPFPATVKGPRWFDLLDRNSDGVLSPREFSGAPQVFAKLDTNSDGLISVQEALDVKKD